MLYRRKQQTLCTCMYVCKGVLPHESEVATHLEALAGGDPVSVGLQSYSCQQKRKVTDV